MARTDNLTNYLTDVAAAIKEKKGDLDTHIPANTFDDEIRNLPSGGGESQYFETDITSSTFGFADDRVSSLVRIITEFPALTYKGNEISLEYFYKGFSGLKKIGKITFTNNFEKINLDSVFSGCTNLKDVSPFFDSIRGKKITSLKSTFFNSPIEDFSFLEDFDFSENTTIENAFSNSKISIIPMIDCSNVKNCKSAFIGCKNIIQFPSLNFSKCYYFNEMFYDCSNMETISEIDLSSATYIDRIFVNCVNLKNIEGLKSLGFSYNTKQANYSYYILNLSSCSKLTYESVINIFNSIYDLNKTYVGDPTPYTQQIKLHADVKALLSEEDIAIATEKGWTVV